MIDKFVGAKKYVLFAFLFSMLTGFSQTTDDTLIVLSNQKLFKVNKNDAGVTPYLNLINPPSFDPFSLEWSETQHCYFGIEHPIGNTIFKISESGVYTSLGPISVSGFNVSVLEGITINPLDHQLYVSGSLNGGPSQGDYCSESLIKLDLTTMHGQYIGTFNHSLTSALEPEADAIEFDEQGMLYYFDCSVNSDNRIFKQYLTFVNPPILLNQTSYWPLSDLTVKDGQVYTITSTANSYNLQKCSTNGGSLQQQAISPGSVFNSASLRGVTWKTESVDTTGGESHPEVAGAIIPNVFTPNGDNVNDVFLLTFPNALTINVCILNRWGNTMIELDGATKNWDGTINGKPATEGVYFYTYEVVYENYSPVIGHGFVTLIR